MLRPIVAIAPFTFASGVPTRASTVTVLPYKMPLRCSGESANSLDRKSTCTRLCDMVSATFRVPDTSIVAPWSM